jgi:hypothetical protein
MLHLHCNARRLHDLRLVAGVTGSRIADRHQGVTLQREVNQGYTVPIGIGTRYVGSPPLAGVILQCFDQVACVHMSGPLSRSHMNARQDGFRDATSKYAVPVVRPGRRVSYSKSGCGDVQPSQIAIRGRGLTVVAGSCWQVFLRSEGRGPYDGNSATLTNVAPAL